MIQIVEIIVWASIFVILLLLELSTSQLITIWFCGGALVSLILAIFDVHIAIQCIVFIAVSVLLLILTKPFVTRAISKETIPTNADALINQEVIVLTPPSKTKLGTGKINDIVWSIKSDDILNEFDYAIIKSISGNKLIVEKRRNKK